METTVQNSPCEWPFAVELLREIGRWLANIKCTSRHINVDLECPNIAAKAQLSLNTLIYRITSPRYVC